MNPLDELTYDPVTGFFHWSISRHKCRYGARAGSLMRSGYWEIEIHSRRYLAHRLAWFFEYGEMPSAEIDHINGDRSDNRLCNLRLATRKQNAANVRRHIDTSSGLKGAYYDKRRNRWFSSIAGKFLGSFQNAQDAHAAYCAAARDHFGEFASLGE
jgi:hypothetical protein